jgi:serine/threonine protein kinase
MSLLSDASRYYEYLPIALDIANGMAYLHSQAILHRDLKPSNVLLTNNKRAKISDFGMSVALTGQELTAETGTYRWMAPEVIKHESYSSNADVYSFGIVLWQLITVRRNKVKSLYFLLALYLPVMLHLHHVYLTSTQTHHLVPDM